MPVPELRLTRHNALPERTERAFVLYWMIGARRTTHNFALDHAVDVAVRLKKPLVILEPLRAGYRWASDRHHAFVVQGMRDNAAACAVAGVTYHAYVEPTPGDGRGLLASLAKDACAVVTDDVPGFFLPRMVAAAAAHKIDVALIGVDSNGLYPLAATDRVFPTAYVFRRHLQKELPRHLAHLPSAQPLRALKGMARPRIPDDVVGRWPAAALDDPGLFARLPIDHRVAPSPIIGGSVAAQRQVDAFLQKRLARYADERSDPDADAQSGLSPYLHFGHIGAHDVFARVVAHERWDPSQAGGVTNGSREGFWGMSVAAESFLDELMTWRELGFHTAHKQRDFDRYGSLPDWARATLARHAGDGRPHVYSRTELEQARTHDAVWNAAQRQLVTEGIIHNYLRMLWGKKILEWSTTPEEALTTLIELNNRYALDGRDANSYSGIFWCLGRFDRAWGPERPIFGTVRYMSSENTKRKLNLKQYLSRWGAQQELR